jgi:tRNA G18 (ribose-2'-O)-methylase SpoU
VVNCHGYSQTCFLNPSFSQLCASFMVEKLSNTLLNRLSTEEFRTAPKIKVSVLLDNVRSMHNVGSILRTCDAFRIHEVILCGITGTPPHREITKTALGADRSLNWRYAQNAALELTNLKQQGCRLYAVEQTQQSIPLHTFELPSAHAVYIFGNEIDGVQADVLEICDQCIEIPQAGTKHSLNVSVAAGIVLWHCAAPLLQHLPS